MALKCQRERRQAAKLWVGCYSGGAVSLFWISAWSGTEERRWRRGVINTIQFLTAVSPRPSP